MFSSQGVKVLPFCSMKLVALKVLYVYFKMTLILTEEEYLANKKYDQCSCDLAVTHLVASKMVAKSETGHGHLPSSK